MRREDGCCRTAKPIALMLLSSIVVNWTFFMSFSRKPEKILIKENNLL